MSTKKKRLWLILICYAGFAWMMLVLIQSEPVQSYMTLLKGQSLPVSSQEQVTEGEGSPPADDPLAGQIQEMAEHFNEEPIDAQIDPVWKAIPGYNGIRINTQKTYQLATQLGAVTPETLVFEEIEADVSLNDLPPAPIYRGNPHKPMVSFMVNVAWGEEYLEDMLETFAEHEVQATFFLDGQWLKRNTDWAQKIADNGHEIGNHAYSHPDLTTMTVEDIKEELQKTDQLLGSLGKEARLFAPPAGAYDERVIKVAQQMGMKTIMWTLDTIDWQKPPAQQIKERIIPHLENGALILMHPTAPTAAALPDMLAAAQEQDFMIGTVSELISPARQISVVRLK